jgi:hypothetical protein
MFGIFLTFSTIAQTETPQAAEAIKPALVRYVDFGIGYIPHAEYKKATLSVAANNLFFNRVGVIATTELNFDALAILVGPTVSVTHYLYVFAEMDFITSRGVFAQDGIKGARKDIGIGVHPWPWAVAKVAYSGNSGIRAEVGLRFPLSKN